MKTKFASVESVSRDWHIIDAKGKILGRMASKIAAVLRGKHKPIYTPHVDTGDFVVVINASNVQVSGAKEENKLYWTHSGYPGGESSISFAKQMDRDASHVIEHAVRGMLPKGALGRKMFKKLKVYSGDAHPHAAQNPVSMSV